MSKDHTTNHFSTGSKQQCLLPVLLINYFFLLFSFSACTSSAQVKQSPLIQCETITYRQQKFDIVRMDLQHQNPKLYWQAKNGKPLRSLKNLKKYFEASGATLQFAMNAGMYLKDGTPQGLYIENGKVLQKVDTTKTAYGNFYLQPNGIFYLHGDSATVCTTEAYLAQNIQADYATQSGPMLVINNQIHPVFVEGSQNLNIRNGVGLSSPQNLIFVISHQKVNLYDFAMLFKERLQCPNALYLDGFVSKAYIPALDRKQLGGNFGVMIGL